MSAFDRFTRRATREAIARAIAREQQGGAQATHAGTSPGRCSMSARYPNTVKVAKWLGSYLIGCALPLAIGYFLGVQKGQEIGRLEMKCAFMAAFERIGDQKPAPGTITLGCEKLGASK